MTRLVGVRWQFYNEVIVMDVNADNLALQLFVRLVQKSNISGMERNSDSLQSVAREAYRAADQFKLVKKDRTKGQSAVETMQL